MAIGDNIAGQFLRNYNRRHLLASGFSIRRGGQCTCNGAKLGRAYHGPLEGPAATA